MTMWENPINVELFIESRQCGMLKDSWYVNFKNWLNRAK